MRFPLMQHNLQFKIFAFVCQEIYIGFCQLTLPRSSGFFSYVIFWDFVLVLHFVLKSMNYFELILTKDVILFFKFYLFIYLDVVGLCYSSQAFCVFCNMWATHCGAFSWRRQWQTTPVLLPGKFHGQRSLVGYSPRGCKESGTTERLPFHFLLLQITALQGAQASVVTHGIQNLGSVAVGMWAQLLRGMWDLPRLELEPMSPALASGFLTPGSPRKSPHFCFYCM